MRFSLPLPFALLLSLTWLPSIRAQTVIPYPDKTNPVFSMVSPKRWNATAPSTADDYWTLEGPTGAVLYFRTVAATLDEAINESQQSLKGTYSEIKLGAREPITLDGLPATLVTGNGTSKEEHSRTAFGMAWLKLPGGSIAEAWYEVPEDDTSGVLRAMEVIRSLKVNKAAAPAFALDVAVPGEAAATADDAHDFPCAPPLPAAKLQKSTHGAEPFAALFPTVKAGAAITTKEYALPPEVVPAQASTAYQKALEGVGWNVVSGVAAGSAAVIAHFEHAGSDLWLVIRIEPAQERISLMASFPRPPMPGG